MKNDDDISFTICVLFSCYWVRIVGGYWELFTWRVLIWFLRYFFRIIYGIYMSLLNLYPCRTATVLLFKTIMIFFDTSQSNLCISFRWIYTDLVSINLPDKSLISKCASIHLSNVYDGCLIKQYSIDALISMANIDAPVNLTIF